MVKVNYKRINSFILLMLVMFVMQSCLKNEDSQDEIDEKKIKEYVTENKIAATRHNSGIYYIIDNEGTGEAPDYDSEVTVKYKGYFFNGTVFDKTQPDKSITFKLNELIPGWQICIPMLKSGGKGTFIIPSYLAYGPQGAGTLIGPNETLIFDIELVSFK